MRWNGANRLTTPNPPTRCCSRLDLGGSLRNVHRHPQRSRGTETNRRRTQFEVVPRLHQLDWHDSGRSYRCVSRVGRERQSARRVPRAFDGVLSSRACFRAEAAALSRSRLLRRATRHSVHAFLKSDSRAANLTSSARIGLKICANPRDGDMAARENSRSRFPDRRAGCARFTCGHHARVAHRDQFQERRLATPKGRLSPELQERISPAPQLDPGSALWASGRRTICTRCLTCWSSSPRTSAVAKSNARSKPLSDARPGSRRSSIAACSSNHSPRVTGWVLYDLANTIFSMGVISLLFPLGARWSGQKGPMRATA